MIIWTSEARHPRVVANSCTWTEMRPPHRTQTRLRLHRLARSFLAVSRRLRIFRRPHRVLQNMNARSLCRLLRSPLNRNLLCPRMELYCGVRLFHYSSSGRWARARSAVYGLPMTSMARSACSSCRARRVCSEVEARSEGGAWKGHGRRRSGPSLCDARRGYWRTSAKAARRAWCCEMQTRHQEWRVYRRRRGSRKGGWSPLR